MLKPAAQIPCSVSNRIGEWAWNDGGSMKRGMTEKSDKIAGQSSNENKSKYWIINWQTQKKKKKILLFLADCCKSCITGSSDS